MRCSARADCSIRASSVGIKVPQQVMGSVYAEVSDKWAVLGSVGWQQWSKFGQVELGLDNALDPNSVTKNLEFKDTWHVALGAQYRYSEPWLVNFGIAYDSKFQSGNVSPLLPVNDAWRFGAGAEQRLSKNNFWGFAGEYIYGGTLDTNLQVRLAGGGRWPRRSRRVVQQRRGPVLQRLLQLEVLTRGWPAPRSARRAADPPPSRAPRI